MDHTKKLVHLSLCSGYDGIGLGLEQAGLDIGFTVHVEIEAFPSFNLVKKIEAGALGPGVHHADLKSFPFGKFRGCVDILSGGFPCQPFSAAGKRGGDEDPRHLFPYIKRGIAACRPDIVFLENVDGIASAKLKGDGWSDPAGTPVLLHVLRELERVGYRATAVPCSASEVGAPHQRNRWFILGVSNTASERGGKIQSLRELAGEQVPFSDSRAWRTWPASPGEQQHGWEPPRVVGDAGSTKSNGLPQSEERNACSEAGESGESVGDAGLLGPQEREQQATGVEQPSWTLKSEVGGDLNGTSGRMGYAELCRSCDNRTDELRMLGNGVVPQSAAAAFIIGIEKIIVDTLPD